MMARQCWSVMEKIILVFTTRLAQVSTSGTSSMRLVKGYISPSRGMKCEERSVYILVTLIATLQSQLLVVCEDSNIKHFYIDILRAETIFYLLEGEAKTALMGLVPESYDEKFNSFCITFSTSDQLRKWSKWSATMIGLTFSAKLPWALSVSVSR